MSISHKILVIDDHPEEVKVVAELGIEVCRPSDLNLDRIAGCDLVIFDFDLTGWLERPDRQMIPFECDVRDGLALAGIIGGAIRERDRIERDRAMREGKTGESTPQSPTAFAIISRDLARMIPPETHPLPHLAARAVGVEWVFHKDEPLWPEFAAALARAVHELPTYWTEEHAERQLRTLLALGENGGWSDAAWQVVWEANPPVYEISRWTDGLAIIRWLAHRVLPYPTFVWTSQQLASRLQISHESLLEQLEGKLGDLFKPVRYTGILADLFPPRWWGVGIDDVLYSHLRHESSDRDSVHEWLLTNGGSSHAILPTDKTWVPCLGEDLTLESELRPIDECVRVHIDEWPNYAFEPWMCIETVKDDPKFQARVLPQDREYLGINND